MLVKLQLRMVRCMPHSAVYSRQSTMQDVVCCLGPELLRRVVGACSCLHILILVQELWDTRSQPASQDGLGFVQDGTPCRKTWDQRFITAQATYSRGVVCNCSACHNIG